MCRSQPDATQLEACGLTLADLEEPPLAIWPDNAAAVRAFLLLGTQWMLAPTRGVVGLRYEALPAVWEALRIRRKARRRVFADLRVMEAAALTMLNED